MVDGKHPLDPSCMMTDPTKVSAGSPTKKTVCKRKRPVAKLRVPRGGQPLVPLSTAPSGSIRPLSRERFFTKVASPSIEPEHLEIIKGWPVP